MIEVEMRHVKSITLILSTLLGLVSFTLSSFTILDNFLHCVCLNQFVLMYCSKGWIVVDEVCLIALT